ncbi:hypothetical protein Efla_003435 [Eimeria flavescens]
MLPPQLRKAVEAAHQTAQQQMQERRNEEDGRLSAQEHSRLAELQKQRAHLEMRQLQAEAGLLTKAQAQVAAAGLEWLYDDPKTSAQAREREREAYLLGKPIPDAAPKADESLEQRVAESVTQAAPVLLPTQDRLRKLREDPLLLIRQAELAQQQAQEANPLLQLQQRQQMQARAAAGGLRDSGKAVKKESRKKGKKKEKKKKQKEKKRTKKTRTRHTRSSSSSSSSSSSEDEGRRRPAERGSRGGREKLEEGGRFERSRSRDRQMRRRSLAYKDEVEATSSRRRDREEDREHRQPNSTDTSNDRRADAPRTTHTPHTPHTPTSSSSSSSDCSSRREGHLEGSGGVRVYGPSYAGAGSDSPAPFRVAEELLPPLAIRQKALALAEAQRNKAAARDTVLSLNASAVTDANANEMDAEQKLRAMQEEGLRREAEKQRRSELVLLKEKVEERIEAQRRALFDATEETRGLRPKVTCSSAVESAREVTLKVRRLQQSMNDLGASNKELR